MNEEKYIYFTTFSYGEDSLYELEFRTLFKVIPRNKILFTNIEMDPSRSVFIKERLEILCRAATLQALLDEIGKLQLHLDGYRINYIKHNFEKTAHMEEIKELRKDSFAIKGEINLKKPKILLGITEIEGTWYFGNLEISRDQCEKHNKKPNSYSSSCGVRVARVMANLAVCHDFEQSVIDPCCGAGTVVLELLAIGANTYANEINWKVAKAANENLKHFDYDFRVNVGDIKELRGDFDVAILDIPYGLFTKIDDQVQRQILTESCRLAKKLVLLTNVELQPLLEEVGYKVVDEGFVDKGNLRRYVFLCERV